MNWSVGVVMFPVPCEIWEWYSQPSRPQINHQLWSLQLSTRYSPGTHLTPPPLPSLPPSRVQVWRGGDGSGGKWCIGEVKLMNRRGVDRVEGIWGREWEWSEDEGKAKGWEWYIEWMGGEAWDGQCMQSSHRQGGRNINGSRWIGMQLRDEREMRYEGWKLRDNAYKDLFLIRTLIFLFSIEWIILTYPTKTT